MQRQTEVLHQTGAQPVGPGPRNVGSPRFPRNLKQTVCATGWTATIRPPMTYTTRLKVRQMRERRLPGTPHDYHEDHLVPLCAGGHPSDARNLWPQPLEGKWRDADKNQLEQSVCRALCRGDLRLDEAQAIFLAPDWTKSYEKFFHPAQ